MSLYAIIVTYNPNLNVFKLVSALQKQGVIPIVVDNGSKNFDFSYLDNRVGNFELIQLNQNLGIATAQNQGIEKAIELGAEQILFFDQDSTISEDFVDNLFTDYRVLVEKNIQIGAIGPRFLDERYGFYYKTISITKNGFRIKHDVSRIEKPLHSTLLISSGSMISVNTLKQVGMMRDHYFIDYVDTEWCLRAEALGYKNYISAKAVMFHMIGDNIVDLKLFKVPIHSSFRRYYRVRNTFLMLNEAHIPKILSLRELFFNTIHGFVLLFSQNNKFDYLKAFFKGVKDGLRELGKAND